MRPVALLILRRAVGAFPAAGALVQQAPDEQLELQLEIVRFVAAAARGGIALALVAPRQPGELGLPRAQPRLLLRLELYKYNESESKRMVHISLSCFGRFGLRRSTCVDRSSSSLWVGGWISTSYPQGEMKGTDAPAPASPSPRGPRRGSSRIRKKAYSPIGVEGKGREEEGAWVGIW